MPLTLLTSLLLSLPASAQYKVTPRPLVQKPASPLLASHFVELGYGFQVEPMMAEMFFNRSFEPYMPYRDNSLTWFGLWNDNRDHSKGFQTDWRKMSWYHSGYEHNAWFAAPGGEGAFHIDRNSTFLVTRSPKRNVEIVPTRDQGEVRHGMQALRVVNRETNEWGGLAQEGKYLRKGESYVFRGWIRSEGAPLDAEVRYYRRGEWTRPIGIVPLKAVGPIHGDRTFLFRSAAFEGEATFSLWIPPQSSIVVDNFSMMPESNFHGWREEVVRGIAALKPKLFRFPGGCFASFYDWRDGVGPARARPVQPSYFWGGMNHNELGTDEFAAMCKRVGAEMMFAVNLYHPKKRDYLLERPNRPPESPYSFDMSRFTDPAKGAREAAAWVAYCNLPAGRHPMADLRARNGRREPWGVKYWELDNETFRWFTAEEHAHAAALYAKAMKAVDPSIRIGAVVYSRDRGPWLAKLLEGAGRDIDFLADRNDAEEGLDKVLAAMRDYNARYGTRLFYANTEWLPRDGNERLNAMNVMTNVGPAVFFDRMARWRLGLAVVKNMLAWQRRGGDVAWINFNNLSNTHGQSAIETPKEGVYLAASGVALSMVANSPAAWPLAIQSYDAKVADEFQVQAAWDLDRKRLVLDVVNRTGEPREAAFDLTALGREFRRAEVAIASAAAPETRNTTAEPRAIHRETSSVAGLDVRETYRMAARPWSFTEHVLE